MRWPHARSDAHSVGAGGVARVVREKSRAGLPWAAREQGGACRRGTGGAPAAGGGGAVRGVGGRIVGAGVPRPRGRLRKAHALRVHLRRRCGLRQVKEHL